MPKHGWFKSLARISSSRLECSSKAIFNNSSSSSFSWTDCASNSSFGNPPCPPPPWWCPQPPSHVGRQIQCFHFWWTFHWKNILIQFWYQSCPVKQETYDDDIRYLVLLFWFLSFFVFFIAKIGLSPPSPNLALTTLNTKPVNVTHFWRIKTISIYVDILRVNGQLVTLCGKLQLLGGHLSFIWGHFT